MDTLHKGENDDDDNNNINQSSRFSVFWCVVELHILDFLNTTVTI